MCRYGAGTRKKTSFRSSITAQNREKLGAAGAVRIVEAAGFDRCACCAPHLDRTGRVGCIKITDAVKYKGGMRFHALCGSDALADYGKKQDTLGVLSRLLSAKEDSITEAVEARLAELVRAKQTVGTYRRALVEARLAALSYAEGSICLFEPLLDTNGLRELAAGGARKVAGHFRRLLRHGGDRLRFCLRIGALPAWAGKRGYHGWRLTQDAAAPTKCFSVTRAPGEAAIRQFF